MGDLSFARFFRLSTGGVACDGDGPRVGGVALLARDPNGAWTSRDESVVSRELAKHYGFPVDFGSKRRGVEALAAALTKGELARAQIITLLLQPPIPRAPPAADPANWKSGVSPATLSPAGC